MLRETTLSPSSSLHAILVIMEVAAVIARGLRFFHSRIAIESQTEGHRPNRYVGMLQNLIFTFFLFPLPLIYIVVILMNVFIS